MRPEDRVAAGHDALLGRAGWTARTLFVHCGVSRGRIAALRQVAHQGCGLLQLRRTRAILDVVVRDHEARIREIGGRAIDLRALLAPGMYDGYAVFLRRLITMLVRKARMPDLDGMSQGKPIMFPGQNTKPSGVSSRHLRQVAGLKVE